MSDRRDRASPTFHEDWDLVRSEGAGPFISRIVHRLPDGSLHTWTSRQHRKGSGLRAIELAAIEGIEQWRSPWFALWAPAQLGWWIAVLFMIGSACFALASVPGLSAGLLGKWIPTATEINAVFFAGSIFFSAAGYLQLLEATNADRRAEIARGESPKEGFRWFAWRPAQIGWLSAFIQFVGTLLFNVNTLDALLPEMDWLQQDLLVWAPDIIGSVCFLVSSWLAVLELCHGYWCWHLRSLSWWIVIVNLLGSVAFMISAVFAMIPPGSTDVLALWLANLGTFVGAVCFLIGAFLLLPEMADQRNPISINQQ